MFKKLNEIIEKIQEYKYFNFFLYFLLGLAFLLCVFFGLYSEYQLLYNYDYVHGEIINIEFNGDGRDARFKYRIEDVNYENISSVDARYSHKIGGGYFIRFSKGDPSISRIEWDGVAE